MPYAFSWLTSNVSADWSKPGIASSTPEGVPVLDAFNSLTPGSGPEGTVVVIAGSNLDGATAVSFDGTTATFTVDSPTQLTATVPTGATTGRITIVTPAGPVTTADAYTVTTTPEVEPDADGFTEFFDEQFTGGAIDTDYWYVYDGSTFGAPTRIQTYLAANVTVGTGSTGSTGGTSLKLQATEIDAGTGTGPTAGSKGTRYTYTAGMLDTKTAGFYLPRYGRFRFRCKTPHGQGLWPSIWLTAKNGGATMAETDILEYFHSQVPGYNSVTLHGTAGTTSTTGVYHSNRYTDSSGFFETPTVTPGWHVFDVVIRPVTDAAGLTYADPTLPSVFVEYVFHCDGVQTFRCVDTAAMYYTSNGGSEDAFWQVYAQGCQVDGDWVGHPRSALGYSHWRNACLISGTAPSSCAFTKGGYTVRTPTFGDPDSTLEVDFFHCDKYTG